MYQFCPKCASTAQHFCFKILQICSFINHVNWQSIVKYHTFININLVVTENHAQFMNMTFNIKVKRDLP